MDQRHNNEKSFKDTLNLPKTEFPIRANAKVEDQALLQRWEQENLFQQSFTHNQGKQKYILHDGPPYANGHIHLGHAYNKILKDIIGKSRRMAGMHVPITPGWDCHGLPIELKVTKEFPELPVAVLKKECRLYAQKWVEVQRQELKQLGVLADWDHPYLTMDFSYEASIVRAFGSLYVQGYIEKKKKTVPWCFSDQTVLAAAEIEYKDRKDPSIYVLFDVPAETAKNIVPAQNGKQISIVVWTTTPWTLPLNRAVLLKPKTAYVVLDVNDRLVIVAAALADKLLTLLQKPKTVVATIMAEQLAGSKIEHPLMTDFYVPIILDHMVSLEDGTAAVHCAPGCGPEDYEVALREGLEIYSPIAADGRYTAEIKPVELAGISVTDGQGWVIKKLMERNKLLYKTSITHAYPHCWRCHNGLIFRATSQWFCNLEHDSLREEALKVLEQITFYPPRSKNFLKATLEGRAEWCLSRQRYWGVPIPAVICESCQRVFTSHALIEFVAAGIQQEGIEYWDKVSIDQLSLNDIICCTNKQWRKETDILDVWFDSGISHYAVLYENPALAFPADMYLEGLDQHRGWFQSSLLTSMILEKRACTKAFLTHGFVVDQRGHKMSKSLGNVTSPSQLIEKLGTDGLRLWVASIDYAGDAVVSTKVVENVEHVYRKIRNTCRFLLSNLYDYDHKYDAIDLDKLLFIDQFALYDLYQLSVAVQEAYVANDFTAVFHLLNDYATVNLSQIYLDVIKDRLYTQAPTSSQRRSAQTAVYLILDSMTKLMAPILSFTAEQVSDYYQKNKKQSIHLQDFNNLHEVGELLTTHFGDLHHNIEDASKQFHQLKKFIVHMRDALLKVIEKQRQAGIIKHPLEATLRISMQKLSGAQLAMSTLLERELKKAGQTMQAFLKELLVVSYIELIDETAMLEQTELPGMYAISMHADGIKCPRCWQWHKSQHPHDLCDRCIFVL